MSDIMFGTLPNYGFINSIVPQDIFQSIKQETKIGGATLTKLLGTSAWYAPGAAVAFLVDSILNDQKRKKFHERRHYWS